MSRKGPSLSGVTAYGLPRVEYAGCPACRLVTPIAWRVPPNGPERGQAIRVGCLYCGDVHHVAPSRIVNDLTRSTTHDCGTTVWYPAAADVVRCITVSRAGDAAGGCGQLFLAGRPPPALSTHGGTSSTADAPTAFMTAVDAGGHEPAAAPDAAWRADGAADPRGRHAATPARAAQRPDRPHSPDVPAKWSASTSHLADDLWWLAHDDRGVPRLHGDVASLGLAAALIAELIEAGNVTIEKGRVEICNRSTPADVLAHTVLDQLMSEQAALPVRTCLAALARTSCSGVAARLLRAGHVTEQVRWRLQGRTTVYKPVHINLAAKPASTIAEAHRRGKPLDHGSRLLMSLAHKIELHRWVLAGTPHDDDAIRPLVADLNPPLPLLLEHTKAAVGDRVITSV